MKPIKPIANGGIAKTSNAANDEIATSNAMPRNCPIIILRGRRLGVKNNNIRTKVSSMFEATKAVAPVARRLVKSVNLQSCSKLVHLTVT